MNDRVRTIASQLRRKLEELYGDRLDRILLFGSQARGDAAPGSDIDVLVVLKGIVRAAEEIARTGEIAAALSLEHDVVVSCAFVSADRYATEQSPLLINVRAEGVPV